MSKKTGLDAKYFGSGFCKVEGYSVRPVAIPVELGTVTTRYENICLNGTVKDIRFFIIFYGIMPHT